MDNTATDVTQRLQQARITRRHACRFCCRPLNGRSATGLIFSLSWRCCGVSRQLSCDCNSLCLARPRHLARDANGLAFPHQ